MKDLLHKRLIQGAIIVLAVFFLLTGGLWGYLHSEAFRSRLVDTVNRRISGSVALENLDISLFPGNVELTGLRLAGSDGTALAAASRIRVGFSWLPLLRRHFHMPHVIVEADHVAIGFDEQDRATVVLALSSPVPPTPEEPRASAPSPWTLSAGDVRIQIQRITMAQPSRGLNGELYGLGFNGNFDTGHPSGDARLELDQVDWQFAHRSGIFQDIAAELAYQPGRGRSLKGMLRIRDSRVQVAAAVNRDAPLDNLNVGMQFDLDFTDIQPWLPAALDLRGRISGQADVSGSLFNPSATLSVDVGPSQIADLDLEKLAVRLGLHQRVLTLTHSEGRGPWGHATLKGRVNLQPVFPVDFRRPDGGFDAMAYTADIAFDGLNPGLIPGVALPVNSRWQGQLRAQGHGMGGAETTAQAELDINGTLTSSLNGDRLATPLPGSLKTRLVWRDQRLDFSDVKAAMGDNHLTADGSLHMDDRQIDAEGELFLRQSDQLASLIGSQLPTGTGHLAFACTGPIQRPEIRGTVLVRDVRYQTWPFGQLFFNAHLDGNGTLAFTDLMLENQGSVIRGSAQLGLLAADGTFLDDPSIAAQLNLEQLQLADFGLLDALKGHFNGHLRVNGGITDPQAVLSLEQSPVGWQGIAAMARGEARWQGGRLDIPRLNLETDRSSLDLSGHLLWRNPQSGVWHAVPFMDLRAESEGVDLVDVYPDVGGRVALTAAVKGPATDLTGGFEMKAVEVRAMSQIFQAVDLSGRLAQNTIFIDSLDIQLAPDQKVRGNGWYAFDGRFDTALAVDALDLKHIDILQQQYPVNGRLAATLKGSGTLADPTIEMVLAVSAPRFNNQRFDDFNGRLNLMGRELTLQGKLNFDIQAHSRLDQGTFGITAAFRHTELSPYLALILDPAWSGRLSGTLEAQGNWHAPEQTAGRLAISDLEMAHGGDTLFSTESLTLSIRDHTLNMPTARVTLLRDGYLEIAGSGHVMRDLQLRMDGRLPLAALSHLTDAVTDLEGIVDLHAAAEGPLSRLGWQAELVLKDAGFGLPELWQGVEKINGTLRLQPDILLVEDLTGMVDTGRLALEGRVRLDGWVPSEGRLAMKLHALPLQWPDTMEAVISGDLALEGSPSGATLSGDLVLVEGLYYKDVRLNLLSGMTQPRRAQPVHNHRPKPEWMQRIHSDLNLRYRNPFLVDNNLARLEVAPDLHLGGTLATPVMSGRATVVDGELMYGRKTFTVQRGVVDFVNPYRIEPTLDISGEVTFRKWTITLGVSGTPDQLAFSLSSDPAESDSDILSLLLVGRTNAEMLEGEGSGRQTTGQMLAQLVASTWGEDIKRGAGMDILEVGAGSEEDVDDPNSMQLTVGKRLSRRLTVKYGVETQDGEMIQRAISEYRFLEHVLATGFQDSQGKYGGELLFRMDFR